MSSTAAKPKPIRRAVGAVLVPVDRLVELGLIGVVRGAGARANHYLPALPRCVAAALSAAAAVDDALPF
jgi:hypothetical protein